MRNLQRRSYKFLVQRFYKDLSRTLLKQIFIWKKNALIFKRNGKKEILLGEFPSSFWSNKIRADKIMLLNYKKLKCENVKKIT